MNHHLWTHSPHTRPASRGMAALSCLIGFIMTAALMGWGYWLLLPTTIPPPAAVKRPVQAQVQTPAAAAAPTLPPASAPVEAQSTLWDPERVDRLTCSFCMLKRGPR